MTDQTDTFDLDRFLPYLLNQAAEVTSESFQTIYKARYGMTRTEWRVLANLGRFGTMTARAICRAAHLEKTKVSRAVAALETDGLLIRADSPSDRRSEILALTPRGLDVFNDLGAHGLDHDRELRRRISPERAIMFEEILRELIAAGNDATAGDGE